MPDFAAEDYEWPEVSELRPSDAGRLLDDIEREATAANRRAKVLTTRKAQAKAILEAVLEDYDQNTVDFTNSEGRRVRYNPEPQDHFDVVNEDEFRAWADENDPERYYGTQLKEGVFRDAMRRRVQDGEPLPPGVRRYTDTKVSRSSTK